MNEACTTVAAWATATVAVERLAELLSSSAVFHGPRVLIARRRAAQVADAERQRPVCCGSRPARLRCWADLTGTFFLHGWLTCGYCCSVPAAFLMAWALPGSWFTVADNLGIKTLALHGLANLWHVLYERMRRGRVHTYDLTLTVVEDAADVGIGRHREGDGARGAPAESGGVPAADGQDA